MRRRAWDALTGLEKFADLPYPALQAGLSHHRLSALGSVESRCDSVCLTFESGLAAVTHVVVHVQHVEPRHDVLAVGGAFFVELVEIFAAIRVVWRAVFLPVGP